MHRVLSEETENLVVLFLFSGYTDAVTVFHVLGDTKQCYTPVQ